MAKQLRQSLIATIRLHWNRFTPQSYYQQNREKIGAYLADYLEFCRKAREEQAKNPSPVVVRLLQLKAEQEKAVSVNSINNPQNCVSPV